MTSLLLRTQQYLLDSCRCKLSMAKRKLIHTYDCERKVGEIMLNLVVMLLARSHARWILSCTVCSPFCFRMSLSACLFLSLLSDAVCIHDSANLPCCLPIRCAACSGRLAGRLFQSLDSTRVNKWKEFNLHVTLEKTRLTETHRCASKLKLDENTHAGDVTHGCPVDAAARRTTQNNRQSNLS